MEKLIQFKLFDKIKEKLKAEQVLVNELSEVLDISLDSAYRRIRGEKLLNINEVFNLCKIFGISLDNFHKEGAAHVNFDYVSVGHHENGFKEYLVLLADDIEKISKLTNKEIIYAATDIPIFHLFRYPRLVIFKINAWKYSLYPNEKIEFKDLEDPSILHLCDKITRAYDQIPATEIWSEKTLLSFIGYIDFFFESQICPDKDLLLKICDDLTALIEDIDSYCDGTKRLEALTNKTDKAVRSENLNIFISEISAENSFILIKAEGVRMAFIKLFALGSLKTNNSRFYDDTQIWIDGLLQRATLISGSGKKQRAILMANLKMKVREVYVKIQDSK